AARSDLPGRTLRDVDHHPERARLAETDVERRDRSGRLDRAVHVAEPGAAREIDVEPLEGVGAGGGAANGDADRPREDQVDGGTGRRRLDVQPPKLHPAPPPAPPQPPAGRRPPPPPPPARSLR